VVFNDLSEPSQLLHAHVNNRQQTTNTATTSNNKQQQTTNNNKQQQTATNSNKQQQTTANDKQKPTVILGRTSHLYRDIERWSVSPDEVPCRFDVPWIADNDTSTLCGEGVDYRLVPETFRARLRTKVLSVLLGIIVFFALFFCIVRWLCCRRRGQSAKAKAA
jgi:hypothetical protein